MRLASPAFLTLLALPVVYLWRYWPRRSRAPSAFLAFSWLPGLEDLPAGLRARWLGVPVALRAVALALLVVALGRPQTPRDVRDVRLHGRNIMLTLDISSSMHAIDLGPQSRIQVARQVLTGFISKRQGDFMGLVVFAAQALTRVPLTIDDDLLKAMLQRVDIGLLPDGTAIGTALAMSLTHLEDLPPKSSVIVLITDGINNTGEPDPLTAAAVARTLGIRIYTIGVSSERGANPALSAGAGIAYGELAALPTAIDEGTLRTIAATTGGQYFRATDEASLARILDQIDRLEKTDLHVREILSHRELFPLLVASALVLLLVEALLRLTWLGTLP